MTSLIPGDIAPNFALPNQAGQHMVLHDIAGQPLILAFCGDAGDTAALSRVLRDGSARLDAENIGIVVVNRETVAGNAALARRDEIVFPVMSDADGTVSANYGLPSPGGGVAPTVILLNVNFHVVAVLRLQPNDNAVGEIIDRMTLAIPAIEPREVDTQAPVLLIPDVLDQDLCRRLIQLWEVGGNRPSGVAHSGDAQAQTVDNPSIKVRRDHRVRDPGTKREIERNVERRVVPEIFKAFNYRVTCSEHLRIVCYDSQPGGYFRAHRDNTAPSTAHRRWAMTINLNIDGYDGGHLRFAEYGPHLYRPPTGTAIIFSGSLLHEVMDVTAGRRFALLAFLYGDEALQVRKAYRREARARR